MNAMTRFTFKSLRANKVRTLVTIAGVVLATALITAVLTSYTSLNGYLFKVESIESGTWMMRAEERMNDTLADRIQEAAEAEDVTDLIVFTDVGFGALTPEQKSIFGHYLPVLDIAEVKGNIQETCALATSEGRLPQAEGEILLSDQWKRHGYVELGGEITFSVGQRRAVIVEDPASVEHLGDTISADEEDDTYQSAQAMALDYYGEDLLLDSSISYLDPHYDEGYFTEELINTHERTFTVVGFYNTSNNVNVTSLGLAGFTAGDPAAAYPATGDPAAAYPAAGDPAAGDPATGGLVSIGGLTSIYMTLSGIESAEQIDERVTELFPDANLVPHTSLLRFMGIHGQSSIWATFYGLIAVLAAVVVIACVSLIYNAFAISVAERVSQFALLSSVGASRRQLRRAVFIEGLFIAIIGIPLGLIVGIGGCAVTFHFLGEQIATIIGSADIPFTLTVAWEALILAAILTVIMVLISVWIPSRKASRADIVDTLRNSGVSRASRKGAKDADKTARSRSLWKKRGTIARLFGIGGNLAVINRKRGVSKGRAASVSLALAIVLLMTAGSLNVFLGNLVRTAGNEPHCDISLTVASTWRGQSASTASEPVNTPDGFAAVTVGTPQEFIDLYQNVYNVADATPEVEAVGWGLVGSAPVFVPESMVGDREPSTMDAERSIGLDKGLGRISHTFLCFVPDEEFISYAKKSGVDVTAQLAAGEPCAIAVGESYGTDGEKYQLIQRFKSTGTISIFNGGAIDGHEIIGYTHIVEQSTYEGVSQTQRIDPYYIAEDGALVVADEGTDARIATVDVPVVAISNEELPISIDSSTQQIVLPLSMLSAFEMGIMTPSLTVDFDVAQGLSDEAASALRSTMESVEAATSVGVRYYITDYVSEVRNMNMLVTVVNVFCLMFTVILALIAMANVFNTVTNSLILRKREFAVMQSVGMSGRQFRSMIVDECLSFGIAGFIPGFIVSAFISYLLWRVVALSLSGAGFMFPWDYAAIAACMTAVVMVISVMYGMHRCKTNSIVEALRTENM